MHGLLKPELTHILALVDLALGVKTKPKHNRRRGAENVRSDRCVGRVEDDVSSDHLKHRHAVDVARERFEHLHRTVVQVGFVLVEDFLETLSSSFPCLRVQDAHLSKRIPPQNRATLALVGERRQRKAPLDAGTHHDCLDDVLWRWGLHDPHKLIVADDLADFGDTLCVVGVRDARGFVVRCPVDSTVRVHHVLRRNGAKPLDDLRTPPQRDEVALVQDWGVRERLASLVDAEMEGVKPSLLLNLRQHLDALAERPKHSSLHSHAEWAAHEHRATQWVLFCHTLLLLIW